jgi:hypothetical protein
MPGSVLPVYTQTVFGPTKLKVVAVFVVPKDRFADQTTIDSLQKSTL